MHHFTAVLLVAVEVCSGSPVAPRILGSSDANIADFPYMLSIEQLGIGHICGAFIVSADWAMTDAWCSLDPVGVEYSIRSGSANLGNGTLHRILQWIHHPQSDVNNGVYDFALIQVDPPFEFGENVAAVGLPAQDEDTPDFAAAVVAGWGQVISPDEWTSEHLRSANITVYGDAACSDYLGEKYQYSKLCAQDPAGHVAVCWRDEGGPLVVNGTVYGVVQWPGMCGGIFKVQLLSRVASVRDWIDSTITA